MTKQSEKGHLAKISDSNQLEETPNALPAKRATPKNEDFYYEDGNVVFTEAYHLKRGFCCDSGCRHCPYRQMDKSPDNTTTHKKS
ncbi:MAG: hypothetical protein HRT45_13505 [Bdellovibrionales bacterium]|nr:hypothetical protein [Bdellovibrionales bacterium]